jgi:hypothetical protein
MTKPERPDVGNMAGIASRKLSFSEFVV